MPTVTLLNRSNRSGSFTTPTFTVPSGLTGNLLLRTNMLETTIATAGKSGSIMVEVSEDGGVTWTLWFGLTWESGIISKPGITIHNSGIGCDIGRVAGKMIRAKIVLANNTNIGFVVETP